VSVIACYRQLLIDKADLAALKAKIYWFLGAFLLNAIAQLVVAYIRHLTRRRISYEGLHQVRLHT
jgi:hypothetical protein